MFLVLTIGLFYYLLSNSNQTSGKKMFDIQDDLYLNGVYQTGDEFL